MLNGEELRERFEAQYPDRNTRWLAWCAAEGRDPSKPFGGTTSNADYIVWNSRQLCEYKAQYKVTRLSPETDEIVNQFLWSRAAIQVWYRETAATQQAAMNSVIQMQEAGRAREAFFAQYPALQKWAI